MGPGAIYLFCHRPVADYPCFGEARGALVRSAKRSIGKGMVGIDFQGLLTCRDRFLELTNQYVSASQTVEGQEVVGVHFAPQFVSFVRFVYFLGGVLVIVCLNIELLPLTYMRSPLKCLPEVFVGKVGLVEVAVNRTQPGVGDGEIGIQFDRHLVERDAVGLAALRALLLPRRIGLESGQRLGSCLFNRSIEFLD